MFAPARRKGREEACSVCPARAAGRPGASWSGSPTAPRLPCQPPNLSHSSCSAKVNSGANSRTYRLLLLIYRISHFIAEQSALAPHLAHPEECSALRVVLVTVPHASRSGGHFPDVFHTPTSQSLQCHPPNLKTQHLKHARLSPRVVPTTSFSRISTASFRAQSVLWYKTPSHRSAKAPFPNTFRVFFGENGFDP